jgi:hypothetical protein
MTRPTQHPRTQGASTLAAAVAATVLAIGGLLTPLVGSASPGSITGLAFNDFNANGVMDSNGSTTDSGLRGVAVTAFDDDNSACGSTSTESDGTFALSHTCASSVVRVEFSTPGAILDGVAPGPMGALGSGTIVSGSSTQFVADNATGVAAGFLRPSDYCQANPDVVLACFYNGLADNDIRDRKALARFSYAASGYPGIDRDRLSARQYLGSVYGLAYNPKNYTVYASAFLRRHIGLGPDGLGAIYEVDSITGAVRLLKDVSGVVGELPPSTVRDLGNSGDPAKDEDIVPYLGRLGMGDLDISDDGSSLYFTNLRTGEVMRTATDNSADVQSFGQPNPGCGSTPRPWGLAVRGSRVYVGVACEDGTRGAVMSTSDEGASWTVDVEIPFSDYTTPGQWSTAPRPWEAWQDTHWNKGPIVADIEFDADNSIAIGIKTRNGLIASANNYRYRDSPVLEEFAPTDGDLLKACWSYDNERYELETNGSCGADTTASAGNGQGPGGGEFYGADMWGSTDPSNGHHEITTGALALLPGSRSVMSTAFDTNAWLTQGVRVFDQKMGTEVRSYQTSGQDILSGETIEPGSLGKADGLGDLELLCDEAPLEIGSRLWLDSNGNGIQDPSEPPLVGVTVDLFAPGADPSTATPIGSVVTDAQGGYVFSNANRTDQTGRTYNVASLTPSTAGFQIVVREGQTALNNLIVTPKDSAAATDLTDSDGTRRGTNGQVITIATGLAGVNDHSFDFGWAPSMSLGNRVWIDSNDDGDIDASELGIDGVVVELLDQSGNPILGPGGVARTETTANGGFYRFDGLLPGSYIVRVSATNFGSGQPLNGYRSSGPTQANPDDNIDSDDNGIDPAAPIDAATNGVSSGLVVLTAGSEPTGEADLDPTNPAGNAPDINGNMTVDFGFLLPVAPTTTTTTVEPTTTTTTTVESTTTTTTTVEPTTTTSAPTPTTTTTTIEPTATTTTSTTIEPTPNITTTTSIEPTTTTEPATTNSPTTTPEPTTVPTTTEPTAAAVTSPATSIPSIGSVLVPVPATTSVSDINASLTTTSTAPTPTQANPSTAETIPARLPLVAGDQLALTGSHVERFVRISISLSILGLWVLRIGKARHNRKRTFPTKR